jgi:hypothetical protein
VKTDDCDAVVDLLEFPWPIKTNSVREIECAHFVEHIPHWRPGWEVDGWWLFWGEVYRICKPKAELTFTHPYCMSGRAFWDPTHERYIHESTWAYLNIDWREREMIGHYGAGNINFEIIAIDGIGIPDDVIVKHHDQQMYMREHYWNVVHDLTVKLRCLK